MIDQCLTERFPCETLPAEMDFFLIFLVTVKTTYKGKQSRLALLKRLVF